MVKKIVLVDVGGTLIKPEVIEEANQLRADVLKRSLPSKQEHAQSEELYKSNRQKVAELTGLTEEMQVKYKTNTGQDITVPAKQYQNQIATDLFRIGMFMVAKKYGQDIAPKGMWPALQSIQDKGFSLAIISGIRTDIISGVLQIAKAPLDFDFIYAQPPILGQSNEDLMKQLVDQGEIVYVIGDKKSDLEPAKALGAKTIWVTWGHPEGGEKEFADYTIDSPDQLKEIIN